MLDVLLIGAEELENLGTRYLAAVLRQDGYTVELAAFSTAQETSAVLERAAAAQPRLIGLSIIFQYRAPEFLALAGQLRQILPHAHITAGGHFPTFAAGELLRDYATLDSVVCGEGEMTLLELVRQLDAPEAWGGIAGLAWRNRGHIVHNAPRPLIADLDRLPFPSRDTLPAYYGGMGVSPISGSRGCYRACTFCSIHAFYGAGRGQAQRFRSVPSVLDEMELLYHGFGVRFFIFNDDEWFPPGPARMTRVADFERELARRHLDVIMSIKCRADDVDKDLFRRLLDLGVVRAYVGIESGSDHSLKTLNKRTTVSQNRRALEILNQVGMLADFGLIFFDPDSTLADVRANLDFFREMAGGGQAPLSFGRLEVYAGTPIRDRLQHEGRLTGNYLAWTYQIADPRVELLFRMMIVALRHRHYDATGLGKQASLAYYELTMCRYLLGDHMAPSLTTTLRHFVARVNNHSLDLLTEMLDFVLDEDLHDVDRVNARVAAWATCANEFDLDTQGELLAWREQVRQSLATDRRLA